MTPLLELSFDTLKVGIPLIHSTRRNITAAGSHWLCSILSGHFSRDTGVQNDRAVVPATGVDQYLHEIFYQLTLGGELLPWNDFILFCSTLRLLEEQNEAMHISTNAPSALTFQEFNSRLCGYFCLRSASKEQGLPNSQDSEAAEREIRLRWSPVKRKKYVSFNLSDNGKTNTTYSKISPRRFGSILKQRNLHDCAGETVSKQGEDPAEDALSRRQLENASLRDLVEELRSTLRSSDARCLALEVALLKMYPTDHPYSHSSTSRVDMQEMQDGRCSNPEGPAAKTAEQDLHHLSSFMDRQKVEVRKIKQHNENKAQDANEELLRLQKKVLHLTRENCKTKKKMEEVRKALACGLEKVKMLQNQALQLPELEKKVSELQQELQHCRPHSCLRWQQNSHTCNYSSWLCSSNTSTFELPGEIHSMKKEMQLGAEDADTMKKDLQMVEKEQLHLSLIEQRLMEVLKLLQKLRPLNISRRYLGNIIMESLESCNKTDLGSSQILQILRFLHEQLLSCDLQSTSEQTPPYINNSLIISF